MASGDECMKNVNPLHIITLLLVLFIFVTFELFKAKEELHKAKENFQETSVLTNKLKGLNKIYSDKEGVRRSIGTILKQYSLKSSNINQSIGKTSITITAESLDTLALNSLMSKILNGSYNLASLKIKKRSDTKASLHMEIKW
ncbi:MAG: hypothetical protein ACI9TV_000266 [Sulfurimonas sp.]|jgi:hypothetical protein|uniref:hypothetical protein n=1 Tax=Sulfurimonas sp. TaxID=2022749 RepID=UPI0039E7230D